MSNNDKKNDTQTHTNDSQTFSTKVICGMLTGVSIAAIFHPWDRGLFLCMTNNRPFLYNRKNNRFITENFTQPYQSFTQTVASRTISQCVYFVAQSQMNALIFPYLRHNCHLYEWQAQLGVGVAVGCTTGVITNSLYAIRSQTWNNPGSTFSSSVCKMWSEGGIKPFMKGITATVSRDATFGMVYEVLRHWGTDEEKKKNASQFVHNAAAAGIATIFSGPLNYVRNLQYATPPDKIPPKIGEALLALWQESKSRESVIGRIGIFPERFKIGAGTARVMVGMASGQYIYDSLSTLSGKIK